MHKSHGDPNSPGHHKTQVSQGNAPPSHTHVSTVQPNTAAHFGYPAGQQRKQRMSLPNAIAASQGTQRTANSSGSSQQQHQQMSGSRSNGPGQVPPREGVQRVESMRKMATQNAIAIARSRLSGGPNETTRPSFNQKPININRHQQSERPSTNSQPQGPPAPGPFERALKEQRRQEKTTVQQRPPRQQGSNDSNPYTSLAQQKAATAGGEAASRRDSASSTGSSQAEEYLRSHYAASLRAGGSNEAPNAAAREVAKQVPPARQHLPFPVAFDEMTDHLKRDDVLMSTLVRKLLGHVPVDGDEYPMVLDPDLISALADKIRLVVHKLVDMQVENSQNNSRKRAAAEIAPHHVIDLSTEDDGDSEPITKRWKALVVSQSQLLEEEKAKVARLTQELAEKDDMITEQAKEAAYLQNYNKAEHTSAAMQHMVGQLDEGMKTVQRQKQEILSLRTVINHDAKDLEERDRTIAQLRQQLTRNETPPTVVPEDMMNELLELREEVRTMSETLKRERRIAESNARSYMRAAVHAVKIHNRRTDKNNEKRR
jgi:hypothetical protein